MTRACSWMTVVVSLLCIAAGKPDAVESPKSLVIAAGDAQRISASAPEGGQLMWSSSDPSVASVYSNGFVVALKPGAAKVRAAAAKQSTPLVDCAVTVVAGETRMRDPATLKQYPDDRVFELPNGKKCVGTELNGHMIGNVQEPRVDRNRVLNPKPPLPDKPLLWDVREGGPLFDGAGTQMGTLSTAQSMFNYGMSKVIDGHLCLYAFSTMIHPDERIKKFLDDKEKETAHASGWLRLDDVTEKESLLENVGVGMGKLPRLPLTAERYRITGGDPKAYFVDGGKEGPAELKLFDKPGSAPVPSHYLLRPTGVINIIYTVPGFSIGGQSLDSVLVTSGAIFRPAKGVRVISIPTYFPAGHPNEGKKSPRTMPFVFGAIEAPRTETIYVWIARGALEAPKAKSR